MNTMRFLLPAFLLIFSSCGTETPAGTAADTTMSRKDSLKKAMSEDLPPPSDIRQFNWFYSAFVHAATTGNDSLFDVVIHPEHGLWIVHSNGAMPNLTNVKHIGEFKTAAGKKLLPLDKDDMTKEPKEEELPVVNCDSAGFYSKRGCFTSMQNTFKDEKIWQYAGLPPGQDKEVAQLAGTITRTVVNTENYRYYFSLIEGSWYLTFLDTRKPCSA